MLAEVQHHAFHFWTWLGHFFGVSDEAGPGYGFFSGVGSDIGELVLIGAAVGLYRRHNCHVTGCWRLARHPIPGTPYVVCSGHHPAVPPKVTAEHVAQAHQEAQ